MLINPKKPKTKKQWTDLSHHMYRWFCDNDSRNLNDYAIFHGYPAYKFRQWIHESSISQEAWGKCVEITSIRNDKYLESKDKLDELYLRELPLYDGILRDYDREQREIAKKSKGYGCEVKLSLNKSQHDKPILRRTYTPVTDEKISDCFDLLYKECGNKNCYSVREAAQKIGIPYEQIEEWSKTDEEWDKALGILRYECFKKAETDMLCNDIEYVKGLKYCIENLDEDDDQMDYLIDELEELEGKSKKETNGKTTIQFQQEVRMTNDVKPKENAPKTQLTAQDEARIDQWRNRREDIATRFEFSTKKIYDPKTDQTRFPIELEYDEGVDESQKYRIQNSTMHAATGAADIEYANLLFANTLCAIGRHNTETTNATFKALMAMKPADEYEGMLITRLIALHENYMGSLARSAQATNREWRDSHINAATKLMRVHNETLEALNKYRRKGEQKVTVTHNHVQVNEGGKAIVGSEIKQQSGGEGNDKK